MTPLRQYSDVPILLVDDSTDFVKYASNYLRDCGLTKVHCANDGIEAVKLAESLHPDIVLLDYELPGINGFEVLRRFHLLNLDLKVILITGHDTGVVGMRGAQLGITDFISKSEFFDIVGLKLKEAIEYGRTIKYTQTTATSIFGTNLDILDRSLRDHPQYTDIYAKIQELRKTAASQKPDKKKIASLVSFLRDATAAMSGNVASHALIRAVSDLSALL
jgi:CheY-like chemotaxis protein